MAKESDERFVTAAMGVATALSLLCVGGVSFAVPAILADIGDVWASIDASAADFRALSDDLWTDMRALAPDSAQRMRARRQAYARPSQDDGYGIPPLPSINPAVNVQPPASQGDFGDSCNCDANNNCPDGAPGPAGPDGSDGLDGEDGVEGEIGEDYIPPPPSGPAPYGSVPPADESRCFTCPGGPPGLPGPKGLQGPPGLEGPKGITGLGGRNTPPGPPGDMGSPGEPGEQGASGEPGSPGGNGQKEVGVPGAKGPAGPPGVEGGPGVDGLNGLYGEVGLAGLEGEIGLGGRVGEPGGPGPSGGGGGPGTDAQYCPCPDRGDEADGEDDSTSYGQFPSSGPPGETLPAPAYERPRPAPAPVADDGYGAAQDDGPIYEDTAPEEEAYARAPPPKPAYSGYRFYRNRNRQQ